MNAVTFTIVARGRTSAQVAFVTDGNLILREDALGAIAGEAALAAEVRELTAEQIGVALGATVQAYTALDALALSRIYPDVFRTGDDVALAARYVALLRRLPGPIQCGTSGLRGQVMLFDPRGLLGALMPVATLPELGVRLPAPAPGAARARVGDVAPDGSGWLQGPAGLLRFHAIALHGLTPRELVIGGLVDCDVVRGAVSALWPAGTARPASVGPPPAVGWSRRQAFDSLHANGLLGEFDGGTFCRLLEAVAPAPDLAAALRDDPIDETLIHRALAQHYGAAAQLAGGAACRDGIFILAPGAPADHTALADAAQRFAAYHGLSLPSALAAPSLTSVADLLATALRAAGRPERIFVVGDQAPFLLLRARIAEHGPLVGATPWAPRAPARPTAFVEAFAERFRVGGVTAITSCARLAFDATPSVPAHVVHVLQRHLAGDRLEPYFFLVTDGLSQRPLAATGPGALGRFELATLSRRHDRELRDYLSWLGETIHLLAAPPGAPPIALGHSITVGGTGGHRGWSAFLLTRMTAPIEGPWGTTEVARVLPITDEERAELRDSGELLEGWRFVTALENRDFDEVLDRWYARLPAPGA